MTPAQLHWVLAHEEAHARRGDNLRLLAESLLRAVLWFNPFVAFAATLAAEAREQLCDQSVLDAADAAQRRAYAETLLLALRLGAQPQIASTLITPGKRSISMRLKAIMSPAQPTPAKAVASFVAIAAAGLSTCLVGAAAWAQTPPSAQAPAKAPIFDITAAHLRTVGCEQIWSGDVSIVSGDRRLKADLLRVAEAGGPNKCAGLARDRIGPRTGKALGNVVYENQGRVERGQSAEIDFRSGGVVVGP
jgi:hypothetical protein